MTIKPAEPTATEGCFRLMLRGLGPYLFLKQGSESLQILKKGVEKAVSNNLVSFVSGYVGPSIDQEIEKKTRS